MTTSYEKRMEIINNNKNEKILQTINEDIIQKEIDDLRLKLISKLPQYIQYMNCFGGRTPRQDIMRDNDNYTNERFLKNYKVEMNITSISQVFPHHCPYRKMAELVGQHKLQNKYPLQKKLDLK